MIRLPIDENDHDLDLPDDFHFDMNLNNNNNNDNDNDNDIASSSTIPSLASSTSSSSSTTTLPYSIVPNLFGYGIISNRNILQGEIILYESPLVIIPNIPINIIELFDNNFEKGSFEIGILYA